MSDQLREFWAIVTADRKKAAVLGGLALVAGGLWIRAAVTSGPSKATASDAPRMTESAKKRAKKLAKSDEDSSSKTPSQTITIQSPDPLTRDLFVVSDALLASSSQMEPADARAPKSAAGIDDKSLRPAGLGAETPKQRVTREAAELRLRSTMIGANPIAVFQNPNGSRQSASMVRIGGDIAGFKLVAVRAHEAELEKEGIRVTVSRTPN